MSEPSSPAPAGPSRPLGLDEFKRYGRQMIMPGFGLPGQLKLKRAKVAVVGAGGLGCPLLLYLAGAGVGNITIIDHDTVSVSNLHRQVLHTTERVGMNKAQSAAQAMHSLNPHVTVRTHPEPISPENAIALLSEHDLLVDCTDRPMTRYLLSDAAVQLRIPLVSGAAISSAGQWAVYGGRTTKGKQRQRACYRCLWPNLINAGGNDRCEELGVYGMVTGMVGVGMASEVIKVLTGNDDEEPLLHLLHLGGNPIIRTIRMRPQSAACRACGANADIRVDTFDYETFCAGAVAEPGDGAAVGWGDRLSAKDLSAELDGRSGEMCVIDTRPEVEFGICSIPNTTNVPLQTILASPADVAASDNIVLICKQGNDSQVAALALRKALGENARIRDVRGGLVAWAKEVDQEFPMY